VSRFRCVDDQKAAGFPVSPACEAAGVSTSGYYDWAARDAAGPTARQIADDALVELMRQIHAGSDGNYGVPRMWKELRRAGMVINEKKVRRVDAPGRADRTSPSTQVPHHLPRAGL
jgi:putative transposase